MPVRPATGTVRWLKPAANGNRRIEISTSTGSKAYEVAQDPEGGFLLLFLKDYVSLDNIGCYHVKSLGRGLWSCDCPDAKNRRPNSCKHAKGLAAALRSLPF